MSPRGPSTESPRARIAARWAPRATKVTSLPAFARAAPNDPPTPPAPITAIRIMSVPTVMLCSTLGAGAANRMLCALGQERNRRASHRCLLYPQKRTLIERVVKSGLCQKRTFRLLLDIIVGGQG